jgi:hypothetical protein
MCYFDSRLKALLAGGRNFGRKVLVGEQDFGI